MFDDIIDLEGRFHQQGRELGRKEAYKLGFRSGYTKGYEQGSEIQQELGFYKACSDLWRSMVLMCLRHQPSNENGNQETASADVFLVRVMNVLQALDKAIASLEIDSDARTTFQRWKDSNIDVANTLIVIRSRFRKASALVTDSKLRFDVNPSAAGRLDAKLLSLD